MSCPTSDVLVAAAAPDASRDVREHVADHLITCNQCAEEFRVLQQLGSWATDHAHLLGESARGNQAPSWTRFGSTWAYATAAVLVLAVAGLEVQVQRLQRDNRTLAARAASAAARATAAPPPSSSGLEARLDDQQRTIADLEERLHAADAPDLNAPIIDLEPADASRSAGSAPKLPAIPSGARWIVFILNTAHPSTGATYDVELVDAGNRVLWTGSGLKQTADRTLTLVVPRALLGNAARLRLFARSGSQRALVEQYPVPAIHQAQ